MSRRQASGLPLSEAILRVRVCVRQLERHGLPGDVVGAWISVQFHARQSTTDPSRAKIPIMTFARSIRLRGRPVFEKASNRTCLSRSATGRPAARACPYPGEAITRFNPFAGAAQGRPGPLSLRAMALSASRTRSPNRGIPPDRVGLHPDRDETPYPNVWHAGLSGKAFWHIAGGPRGRRAIEKRAGGTAERPGA
jgi:hypothetical protein